MIDGIRQAKTAIRCAAMFAAACYLAACGGGGGSNSADANTSSSVPPSSSTTTSIHLMLSGTPAATVKAGSAYSFQPAVSQNSGTVQFSITGNPAWAVFDATTGVLSGTPTAADEGTSGAIVITA